MGSLFHTHNLNVQHKPKVDAHTKHTPKLDIIEQVNRGVGKSVQNRRWGGEEKCVKER